jgi:hypothetical protein
MHVDALLAYAARHSGLKEVILRPPMAMYHLDHARGHKTPERQARLVRDSDGPKTPELSHDQFEAWALQMCRQDRPILFNGDSWGLGEETLEEVRFSFEDGTP